MIIRRTYMITIPEACAEGTCRHGNPTFPHMVVTTSEYTVKLKGRGWVTIPSAEFIVCLACHHWPDSVKPNCQCEANCHESVIYSKARQSSGTVQTTEVTQ
jgi:hypothetical protein